MKQQDIPFNLCLNLTGALGRPQSSVHNQCVCAFPKSFFFISKGIPEMQKGTSEMQNDILGMQTGILEMLKVNLEQHKHILWKRKKV